VRFARGQVSRETAAANSRVLFDAAVRAGIGRIVHVSITHADPACPHPHFRGKAEVEAHLISLGVPYAVAHPAILFGGNGVLVNNIAWLLRRLPVFAIGGRGGTRAACRIRAERRIFDCVRLPVPSTVRHREQALHGSGSPDICDPMPVPAAVAEARRCPALWVCPELASGAECETR
jgi:uncharacterized protein YbjT (DUF2867 family)